MDAGKTNQLTTAADMQPIVDAGRAEGLTDAEIVERWMRQARPDGDVSLNEAEINVHFEPQARPKFYPRLSITWLSNGEIDVEAEEFCSYEWGDSEQWNSTEYDLPSALAWLANQLRERCPVAAIRDSRDERAADGAPFRRDAPVIVRELWFHLSGEHFGDAEHAASAARIRRMFAIAEPGEVVE